MPEPLLELRGLCKRFGGLTVTDGVSLTVMPGEIHAIIGPNGAGKTTAVAAIMGLLPCWDGAVSFGGQEITGIPPYRVAQRGIGWVPEGRQIFPTLSVEENLIATASRRGAAAPRWTLAAIWTLFPRLHERRRNMGHQLSGGEQQMLAIGRALMTNPRLLVLDEATEGLAPVIRAEIWQVLAALKAEGQSLLLIDKNLAAVLRLVDAAVVLEKGRPVWEATAAAFAAAPHVRDTYLHI